MSKDKVIKIDSRNSRRPHVRHRAIVNKVRVPYSGAALDDDKVLNSEIALTVCGRAISNFWNAEDTSLLFTNGDTYARECDRCFK